MAAGPILLFDKSALQSLTVDESVWLDHFFLTNITPIFYVETLADLVDPKGRSADEVVGNMADKTPVFHPHPNVFHRTLLVQDLLGEPVPMTGQIMLAGGIAKRDPHGGNSVFFKEPAEAETMQRWQAREFQGGRAPTRAELARRAVRHRLHGQDRVGAEARPDRPEDREPCGRQSLRG